jgi:hypothetical protein
VAAFIGEMAIAALRRIGPNRPTGKRLEDAIELLRSDLDYLALVAQTNPEAKIAAPKPARGAKRGT